MNKESKYINKITLKKAFILFLILIIPTYSYAIKFKFKTADQNEFTLKAVFDNGIAIKAVADGAGITDYEVLFFKAGLHFLNFGIGINLEFRFRFFLQSLIQSFCYFY